MKQTGTGVRYEQQFLVHAAIMVNSQFPKGPFMAIYPLKIPPKSILTADFP
jgi:hypothetical protein